MVEFLSEINWSPLWISLKTGVAATIFAFFLGVFCARKIMKLKPGARAVLDGILTMPLVPSFIPSSLPASYSAFRSFRSSSSLSYSNILIAITSDLFFRRARFFLFAIIIPPVLQESQNKPYCFYFHFEPLPSLLIGI